jgi:SAM-dependent methyltransferase
VRSSRVAEPLAARLAGYYTRYYRDTLGIPGWRDLVGVRLDDTGYEAQRLAQLERAIGLPVRGSRVLNLGCGTGGFSAEVARAGASVWSIDASWEAVAITAARVSTHPAVEAAAEALPLASGSMDIVYCFSTLEHVADRARAIREMLRVLRPGGRLYVHAPNRWACFEGHYKVFWIPGLPRLLARAYLALRGRPTAFLDTVHPTTVRECSRLVQAAGGRVLRVLDEGGRRPVGGPLWQLVRLYYRLFGVRPYVELVVTREPAR